MARARPATSASNAAPLIPKWAGRCDACGALEHARRGGARAPAPPKGLGGGQGAAASPSSALERRDRRDRRGADAASPSSTGSAAAGWCRARRSWSAAIPGIGKSTLLLQVAAALAGQGGGARLRLYLGRGSARPGAAARRAARRRRRAGAARRRDQRPRHRRRARPTPTRPISSSIDSIQTMYLDTLDSAPGTVSQVRAAAQELIRLAKRARLHRRCWSAMSPRRG